LQDASPVFFDDPWPVFCSPPPEAGPGPCRRSYRHY